MSNPFIKDTRQIATDALPKGGGVINGNLEVTGTLTADLTGNADSATKDSLGNVIKDTYTTKTELSNLGLSVVNGKLNITYEDTTI